MLLQASAHAIPLADESVQCVMTSPPYWGLRSYAGEQEFAWDGDAEHDHQWGDLLPPKPGPGNALGDYSTSSLTNPKRQNDMRRGESAGAFCDCGAWHGALGLEPTPDLYVEHMVEVLREVRRVLRDDGTLWLNLGDSYAGSWGAQSHRSTTNDQRLSRHQIANHPQRARQTGTIRQAGLKPKDLIGIPWRVALALQADGWWLRSDIVWSKPNPMPESIRDRPTKAHEYVFLLSKSERYFYDADAVREAGASGPNDPGRRNARSVWTIATQPYPGTHFATFPVELAERCVLAGSSRQACGECAAPWTRIAEHEIVPTASAPKTFVVDERDAEGAKTNDQGSNRARDGHRAGHITRTTTLGWEPTCDHHDPSGRSVVLDPFAGTSTTGVAALRNGRAYVGLDLSRTYLIEHSRERLRGVVTAVQDALFEH